MPDESKPEENSEIKPAELPSNGFSSTIPQYLLEGKSEAEQYVLNEVSKMSQFIEWAAPLILDNNLQARRTNGRLKKVEAWKAMFGSWWALSCWFGGLVLAVLGAIAAINGLK